jgi:hypothetical protein
MMFVIGSNSASTGYNLTRSLRVRNSATAYLNRTPASATNRQTWTYSAWVKLSPVPQIGGFDSWLLTTKFNGVAPTATTISINTNYKLVFASYDGSGGSPSLNLVTTQVFRDYSAWYHIVVVADTTQATAANRAKLYVNGVQITSFTTATYPAQNYNTYVNNNDVTVLGALYYSGGGAYSYLQSFDSYLAETNFIDGQALTPSSFGSTNALTGVWQPARYTGSYGTNGFYLPFTDNSALTTSSNVGLGQDFSGNGNYWVTNNISVTAGVTYDSMTDVPTLTSATAANFCVMNPLDRGSNVAISNGNLTLAPTSAPDCIRATFGLPSTGQWYWEVTVTAIGSGGNIGVATQSSSLSAGGALTGVLSQYTGYYSINSWSNNGSYTAWTTGDVIAVAVNTGTGAITFYKNGTSLGVIPTTLSSSSVYFPFIQGTSSTYNVNFGQRPFTYTPPTGFVALNTFNLPTSTIVKGNTVMDATTWTGNNATNAIVNAAAFKPDLVWIKDRSRAGSHVLVDSVRGVTKALSSDGTWSETTYSFTQMSSINSNGFTLTANTTADNYYVNVNADTFVGWQWQAGQGTTSSNTSGTITSTVSVNASAGFSVVTYTGTGVAGTIGHGLGVAPQWIITKQRNSDTDAIAWASYHVSLGNSFRILLNTTDAAAGGTTAWNSTNPTSSVFSVGAAVPNNTSQTYVAYCWTPIAGFSAFGSYTGNGSTDGTFVYTGFRPKFILIKGSSFVSNWFIEDSARNGYNVNDGVALRPNLSNAEDGTTTYNIDILSNGFKLRSSAGDSNTSGATFIYAAFAENPTKNALAR